MTLTKNAWMLLAFCLFYYPSLSFSMDPEKFHCFEMPQPISLQPKMAPHPMNPYMMVPVPQGGLSYYSDLSIKDCGGTKEVTKTGVCIEMVKCVYLNDELLRKLRGLTEDQKTQLILKNLDLDVIEAILTCKAAGDHTCPMPKDCQGDSTFHLSIGNIAPSKISEASQRVRTFQPNSGEYKSGVGK